MKKKIAWGMIFGLWGVGLLLLLLVPGLQLKGLVLFLLGCFAFYVYTNKKRPMTEEERRAYEMGRAEELGRIQARRESERRGRW